ncbi:MAG: glycoside hydrolase family 18 protein [Actinoplanes sp.]
MRPRHLLIFLLLLTVAACDGSADPSSATSTKVVGYFTNWGVYGRDFQVRDVSAGRLTHLVYAFGQVTGGRCAASDEWADYEKPVTPADSVDGVADRRTDPLRGNFGQLRKLKAKYPQLRVIWSFGGWTSSAGFTQAARDPAGFAASCHALLTDERWAGLFDGIDVDWEYANACGLTCDTSGSDALPNLLTALRGAFGADALITAAVPGDLGKLSATDYAAAAGSADWLSAMTYDYFGTGGTGAQRTAAHSPLTAYDGIPQAESTASNTVEELIRSGVPSEKVLLGVGFYGRGWTGVTTDAPGGTATGPAPGKYEKGMEDYKVLAARCPATGTVGGTAYARCGAQWWSFDTPETVRAKMAYARSRSLGGAFAWELSGDTKAADLLGAMATGLASE